MNCRDFCEIADSYLSDELAVETNHEVFQHLEKCPNCRQELSMRREVREKLCISLKNSSDFRPNPGFANKLKSELQDEAFQQTSWLGWKILLPVFTSLLIVAGLTLSWVYQQYQITEKNKLFLAELSKKAVNRHEDCGLKHFQEWEENIGKISAEKISFVKPLENNQTQILEVHDCKFEGKMFTHYVLRRNGKIISVLKTASENLSQTNNNEENAIVCERGKGLQMSSFKIGEQIVFVISDMSETENLSIARQLSDSAKA